MNQPPLFLAVRAISAEFAQRMYLPVVLIGGGIIVTLIIVSIWLVTISGWWWFLLAPLIFIALLFAFTAAISALIVNLLQPQQTRAQKKEVKTFVDGLQSASEAIQTPKFILLFRLIKDVVFPSQKTLINEFTANMTSLKPGFEKIVASFSKH